MDQAAPDPLTAIRNRIDAIDERMHRLLIERSGVIAELIEIKGASKPGAAFRPDREADMMRRIAMRHEGGLPLATVEHIWREIITSFTAMQAPFGIAAGPAEDAAAMRDAIRFYFGFSIPLVDYPSREAAIARVAESERDIAVIALGAGGRWWGGLAGAQAPKVFARLPFIETPNHPARLPSYVVGPPLKAHAAPDVEVFSVAADEALEASIQAHGGHIAARDGSEIVVELPVAATLAEIARAAAVPVPHATPLGGFHQPIRHVADRAV